MCKSLQTLSYTRCPWSSKAGDDRADNKRGPPGPPPLGLQIRPLALPLENRLQTQRKLLSAALPHLSGLSQSKSELPLSTTVYLPLSFPYSVSEMKHRPFHPQLATVLHPDTTGQPSSGYCSLSRWHLFFLEKAKRLQTFKAASNGVYRWAWSVCDYRDKTRIYTPHVWRTSVKEQRHSRDRNHRADFWLLHPSTVSKAIPWTLFFLIWGLILLIDFVNVKVISWNKQSNFMV